jgi:hypothetical protein
MKTYRYYLLTSLTLLSILSINPQSRIHYNNQDLFLSGANLAWVSFANDVGPNQADYNSFSDAMLSIHASGGNSMRWWLHTNGTNSPAFNDAGLVVGPGSGSIEDIKTVLDLAWEREIGLKLCLWSFDMLRSSNDTTVLKRNRLMLLDTNYTRAYINNSLIPMVDSLKDHPGIIAWEIFNEPEGMSNEFGWGDIQHVPMAIIQRFINLCSAAIHRTDPNALVTSGAWCFLALTDIIAKPLLKEEEKLALLSSVEKEQITRQFNQKYRMSLTTDEVFSYLQKIAGVASINYYSDGRLIAAGGDADGILDFYSVHFYATILPRNQTSISPFHHPKAHWGLDKPIVVAEFSMQNTLGVLKENLFDTLYQNGYAGALPWSWGDANFSSRADMLAGIKFMWDNYRSDVDVNGISGDWPEVSIINPQDNSVFPDSSDITIEAEASDADGSVILVEFFVSDTLKIGERDTIPYTITWTNAPRGSYTLTAVATDDSGHQRISNQVKIQIGAPLFVNLEAESAVLLGADISVLNNPQASNGSFVRMETNVGSITWTLPNVPEAGEYTIKFGYRLWADRPKNQYINVNGERVTELVFDSTMNIWLENPLTVSLIQGSNTIQMELLWGWMDLDYLAVPVDIGIAVSESPAVPAAYSLDQNYPNPFNPETNIRYSIVKKDKVKLSVYDILGRRISVLVDKEQNAGVYTVPFKAAGLSSGVYFYQIEIGSFIQTKSMILIK